MHTIETRYPDGTRARYKLQDGSSVPLQLLVAWRYRLKRPKEKRQYPQFSLLSTSTARYVREYYRINALGSTAHFEPLNESRAAWPMGVDTVETVEEGEE